MKFRRILQFFFIFFLGGGGEAERRNLKHFSLDVVFLEFLYKNKLVKLSIRVVKAFIQ